MSILKKSGLILLSLLIIGYIIARIIAPTLIDRQFNRLVIKPPYSVSAAAQQLYDSLDFIADLHSDALLWKRDLLIHNDFGHGDVPRMIHANMALQAFTIVNKVPNGINFESNSADSDKLTLPFILQGRPLNSWFDLTQRVITQAQDLHDFSKKSNGLLSVIKSKTDFAEYLTKRKSNPAITAGFLGIEGAQALQGELKNIDKVYTAGIRMIGLTHFFDNELGGSAHGISHSGLTDFGRKAVKQMQQQNILIDLAHASPQMIDDVLGIAVKPVMISHTGVKGTCDNVRNLSDKQLKGIAKTGGIVGIAMFKQAVCGENIADIANAIVYTCELIGARHVVLGSDFDGAVNSIIEVRGLPLIVQALLEQDMSEDDIRLIMGENVKRFLSENLPD